VLADEIVNAEMQRDSVLVCFQVFAVAAGRKSEGKKAVLVTLTEKNVKRAKKREANFSGLLDRLLAEWLA
jgi:hypothetical protein